MIKINLLPRKPRKRPFKIDLFLFFLVLVINIVIAGAIYYGNTREITNYETKIENGKKEIASLDGLYKDYLRMEAEKKEISLRIKTIDSLKTGRALAARTLYDLSSVIKESVWLRTFKKDEDRFEMEGRSLENESISELMERLSKIPYMRNVELRNVEDVAEGGITVKKFVIYGNIGL
jgi:Tfp pilus assembly protein PilN